MATLKQKKDGTPSRQGEGGGSAPKYANDEELQQGILGYFDLADSKKKIYSKAGLLGFLNVSRPTWMEYRKKYPNTIRAAEFAIEEAWVERLASPGATGAIFYLKNAFKEDYRDRSETDLTSGGDKFQTIIYLPAKDVKKS